MPQRLQFSLRSLLLIVIVTSLAVGLYAIRSNWIRRQQEMRETPLEWPPFTQQLLDETLENGQPALVVYYSHWKSRPLWRIENPDFRYLVRKQNILTIDGNAHMDHITGGEIRTEKARLRKPTNGSVFVAIYRPGVETTIFEGYPDKLNENAVRILNEN